MIATNNKNIPLSLAVFLATDHYDYNNTPKTISTTTLLKPTREILLGMSLRLSDMNYDVSQKIQSSLGTAIHEGIENAWLFNHTDALKLLGYPDKIIAKFKINPKDKSLKLGDIPVYLEQRLTKPFKGWTITGKMDFIVDGQVEDFKNTSIYQVQNDLIKDKTTKQLSILRWLDPQKITEDTGSIQYIIKDWRGYESYAKNYPPLPIYTETVSLASYLQTEQFIEKKLHALDHLQGKDQSNFPLCNDSELWKRPPPKPFKYYKDPTKTSGRSTKNFVTLSEAQYRLQEDGSIGTIITLSGEIKACKYCSVLGVCDQAKGYINSGELKIN